MKSLFEVLFAFYFLHICYEKKWSKIFQHADTKQVYSVWKKIKKVHSKVK